jgi:UDP-glucose:O-linked fucose beta-1,3-glucosyltransferase
LFDGDAWYFFHPNKNVFKNTLAKSNDDLHFSSFFICRLVDHLLTSSVSTSSPTSTLHSTDFFIDSQFELSYFLWNINNEYKLKNVPYFCNKKSDNCSIYAKSENIFCVSWIINDCDMTNPFSNPFCFNSSLQGNPVNFDKILFAVKTCAKFHNERLPVILKTWAQYALHLRLFSDVEDSSIPTVATGVQNTESGHCEKSMRILKMVVDEISRNHTLKNIEWVVLADDDTILR